MKDLLCVEIFLNATLYLLFKFQVSHVYKWELTVSGNGTVDFSDFLVMLSKVDKAGDTEDDLDEAFRQVRTYH